MPSPEVQRLTRRITKLEDRVKTLESALKVTATGVTLKSTKKIKIVATTGMDLNGGSKMVLKAGIIDLN